MKYLKAIALLIFIVIILVKSYNFGYELSKKAFSRSNKTI